MRIVGRLGVVAACVAVLGCGSGPTAPGEGQLGVLFIGNSLTASHDMPGMLGRLLAGSGVDAHIETVLFPNFALPDHWSEGSARQALALGGWDVVVLQQGPSATEGRPYLLEYTEIFAKEIRGVGARPALLMVWPSALRPFDFAGVSDSYRTAAELVDGLLFPVGEAWLEAWEDESALPLYGPDGFHPSLAGSYLAALVIFQQLAGVDPRTLTDAGDGTELPQEVVAILRQAAARANAAHARP